MRQLKNFMKAKSPMWRCGECKCVTLQCRRDNDEFCNCGSSTELMSWEDFIQLNDKDEMIAILNSDNVWYYNKFSAEWHTQEGEMEQWVLVATLISAPNTPLTVDGNGFIYLIRWEAQLPLNTWTLVPVGPQPTGKTVTLSVVNVNGDAEDPMEAPISETCWTIEKQQVTVPVWTQWETVYDEGEPYIWQWVSIYFYNDDIQNPIETVRLTPSTSSSSAGYAVYDVCTGSSDNCWWGEVQDNTTLSVYFAKHAVYTVTIQANDATKWNVDINAVYVQTNGEAYVEPDGEERNKLLIDGWYVTATPASGYTFWYWEDQDWNMIDNALQIVGNITITAIFQEGR